MAAYFERLDRTRFRATDAVEGAWNTAEQHIAPVLGLIAHEIERDHAARRPDPLPLARISYDILGTLPIDVVNLHVRVVRPGRTIELIEATLGHDGRSAVIARAWLVQAADTAAIAGSALPGIPPADELERWDAGDVWPGAFVRTIEARRRQVEPGRAVFWLRPTLPLLADETIGPTSRALSVVNVANGATARVAPTVAAFPNLDLTVHLFRQPAGAWVGFDTTVSFGAGGLGLTHSVLHDGAGPLGSAAQTLTVRPHDVAS